MSAVTLAQAQDQLAAYLEAERKALDHQSYVIGTRAFTFADLAEIREGIRYWSLQVNQLKRGGIRVRGAVPACN